jgi:hypothetical protein
MKYIKLKNKMKYKKHGPTGGDQRLIIRFLLFPMKVSPDNDYRWLEWVIIEQFYGAEKWRNRRIIERYIPYSEKEELKK